MLVRRETGDAERDTHGGSARGSRTVMSATRSRALDDATSAQRSRRERSYGWRTGSSVGTTALAVAGGIAVWQIASRQIDLPLFPTPLATLAAVLNMLRSGSLASDVLVSLQRIVIGFALGCVVGIPLGLAMGLFRLVRALCEPVVQFLRFVPAIAWLIPAIIWFGIGETSKVVIVFYMTVFLILLNTMAGVAALNRNQLRAARNYGVTRWQLFAWIVVPATMSYSVAGARIALGNSFAAVVGAELIAADAGLGYRIVESGKWMAMDDMFGAMLVLGALGIAADRIVSAMSARFLQHYLPPTSHA
jgi:ABC-type nitrate/sulfonate/bicarbonate transport system permease component